MSIASSRTRALLWKFHRWIGIGLVVLLVPVAVSGALLVYQDELDAFNELMWH